LLLQEFDYEIRDKKGSKNLVVDHLFRIVCGREFESYNFVGFPNEQFLAAYLDPLYADIMNHLVSCWAHESWTKNDRDKFFHLVKFFV